MRPYLQGLITGGLFVFAFLVLIGSKENNKRKFSKTYKDKLLQIDDRLSMIEGSVNERFKITGENFMYLKRELSINTNSEYNFKSMKLVDEPYPFNIMYNKSK
tara:strand:- start:1753 stop:2061 length:309 start_codon:yes stop_codon:yes gene_type:complete